MCIRHRKDPSGPVTRLGVASLRVVLWTSLSRDLLCVDLRECPPLPGVPDDAELKEDWC